MSAWCVRSHRRLLHWRAIGWTPHGRGGLWSLVSNTMKPGVVSPFHLHSPPSLAWKATRMEVCWTHGNVWGQSGKTTEVCEKQMKATAEGGIWSIWWCVFTCLYCRIVLLFPVESFSIVLHSFWGYNFGHPNDLAMASPCKLGIAWLTGGDSSYHRLGQDRDRLCTLPASVRWFLWGDWGAGNWESRSKEYADVRCLSVTFPFLFVGQAIFGVLALHHVAARAMVHLGPQ